MNWNHLPMDGGLFRQHPVLLERFFYIFQERAKVEEQERARERNKHKVPTKMAGRRFR